MIFRKVYFTLGEGRIHVSETRIEINGQTFDPAKLTEATVRTLRPGRFTAVIVAFFALFFLLLGAGATSSGPRSVGIASLVVGVLCALGVRGLWREKRHILLIDGKWVGVVNVKAISSPVRAPRLLIDGKWVSVVDPDGAHAADLAARINRAIAARKQH